MLNIRATDLASIYGALVRNVYEDGADITPRGKACSEIIPATLGFSDVVNCMLDSADVNYRFATAELMGYLCGWSDVPWLARFNKNIAGFSDDGETFHGAYGPRMEQQLEDVVQLLNHDEYSRQAIVQIWHPRDLTRITKDKPCHTELQLYIRGGRLHMIIHQRSLDLVWGLPYDHFSFCLIQQVMAKLLDVVPGTQFRVVGSMHVYKPEAGYYPMTRIAKAMITPPATLVPTWWQPEYETLEDLRHSLEEVRKLVEDPLIPRDGIQPWQTALSAFLLGAS
jgi:thymidylate synthase